MSIEKDQVEIDDLYKKIDELNDKIADLETRLEASKEQSYVLTLTMENIYDLAKGAL